jgi:phage terminase Nu1 subunit (DNA packaging protein)
MNSRLASHPTPPPSPDFTDSGCTNAAGMMREYRISRPTLERLVRGGMPCINVGTGRKRALRFHRAAVAAWLRNRI